MLSAGLPQGPGPGLAWPAYLALEPLALDLEEHVAERVQDHHAEERDRVRAREACTEGRAGAAQIAYRE